MHAHFLQPFQSIYLQLNSEKVTGQFIKKKKNKEKNEKKKKHIMDGHYVKFWWPYPLNAGYFNSCSL